MVSDKDSGIPDIFVAEEAGAGASGIGAEAEYKTALERIAGPEKPAKANTRSPKFYPWCDIAQSRGKIKWILGIIFSWKWGK